MKNILIFNWHPKRLQYHYFLFLPPVTPTRCIQIRSPPALQSVDVFFLLLPALLGRLLIANLSAYFLQNSFLILYDGEQTQIIMRSYQLWSKNKLWIIVFIENVPLWGAVCWAESPPPLSTASSHPHWESTLEWIAGKAVGAGGEIQKEY